jgi:hypothetical protein
LRAPTRALRWDDLRWVAPWAGRRVACWESSLAAKRDDLMAALMAVPWDATMAE